MDSVSLVYVCPYDGFPCSRYNDDLGAGVCETKSVGELPDVCPRFVMKSHVPYIKIDFSKSKR